MKKSVLILTLSLVFLLSCRTNVLPSENATQKINTLLNQWHRDVAEYKFDAYFDKLTNDAVFVGTDASEVWNKTKFMSFSKPYFDKRQTWDFEPLQRNIYLDLNDNYAAFDELLNTWMGLCRGSGIVVNTQNGWKIKHYVLSVAVPNDDIQKVIKAKQEKDSLFLIQLKGHK